MPTVPHCSKATRSRLIEPQRGVEPEPRTQWLERLRPDERPPRQAPAPGPALRPRGSCRKSRRRGSARPWGFRPRGLSTDIAAVGSDPGGAANRGGSAHPEVGRTRFAPLAPSISPVRRSQRRPGPARYAVRRRRCRCCPAFFSSSPAAPPPRCSPAWATWTPASSTAEGCPTFLGEALLNDEPMVIDEGGARSRSTTSRTPGRSAPMTPTRSATRST